MKTPFAKMQAAGNDFLLIDNRTGKLKGLTRTRRRRLCTRKTGIGADGILLLEKDERYPFMMRYFNADGGEAALCGNGARCVAHYAYTKGLVPRMFVFRSRSAAHSVTIHRDGSIEVSLPPCTFGKSRSVPLGGKMVPCFYATVGVPHLVIFTRSLGRINVPVEGKRLRNLKRFRPQGTNVDFVMVAGPKRLQVRTYERGVENETLACGTGVAAASAVALAQGIVSSPVRVKTASGETITVRFGKSGDTLIPHLIGKAHFVFFGTVIIP